MESTNIIPINIEDEMRGSYIDYAMSVIVGRALPDVRDGLKPVHRRILYAMLREGLTSSKKYSKCAGVVGEVLKHYHPHGDLAVYHALARMAQYWNLRYPLIDGQGNFGSIDGDSPAAYRYTECRMQALAEHLLDDIDKETVDFQPNFDDSITEPTVLPSRVPNLLINGAEGIAVGMASSIPPHNITEVIKGVIALVKNPDISVDDLMQIIPAPDFPTGGIIYGTEVLKKIYHTGRGILKIRGKVRIEEGPKESERIVFDELPFQVNKAKLVEKIAELVNQKRIEGISKLRDESDRNGMRVVVELKRDAVTDVVLNQLYKLTPLQKSYGVTMLAIVEGKPKILSLKDSLGCFVNHRQDVIVRRSRFELKKAEARLHILEGLRTALDNIEEVIKLIRASESSAIAKAGLKERFQLSDIQAQHILDMPLKRLTGLERKAIEDEYEEVTANINRLKEILGDSKEVDKIVITELEEILSKYGDTRKTEIEETGEEIDYEDLIAEEEMVVSISHRGYAKRCSPSNYKAQKRGGKGVRGTKKLSEGDEDFVSELFVASTHAYLLVFTSAGKLHWIKVYNLPEAGRTARGRAIVNMLKLGDEEKVSAILPVKEFEDGKYVVMATKQGYVKRVNLMDFSNVRNGGIRATNLDEGDELVGVTLTEGDADCIMSTASGMAIRFSEDDARVMGRTARGSRGIKIKDTDQVVSLIAVKSDLEEETALLTACEHGYGKRTKVSEYRRQSRGGKGVIDIKTDSRNGEVVETIKVRDSDEMMIVTTSGKIIRMEASGVSLIGRNTKGVRLIGLDENEKVATVGRIADSVQAEEELDEATDDN